MINRCKLNPCCGDPINCDPPYQEPPAKPEAPMTHDTLIQAARDALADARLIVTDRGDVGAQTTLQTVDAALARLDAALASGDAEPVAIHDRQSHTFVSDWYRPSRCANCGSLRDHPNHAAAPAKEPKP